MTDVTTSNDGVLVLDLDSNLALDLSQRKSCQDEAFVPAERRHSRATGRAFAMPAIIGRLLPLAAFRNTPS